MDISDIGLELICGFEGFSPIPYPDTAGNPSIGFGHRILPNEQFTSITEDQAKTLLSQDVRFAEEAVNSCVKIGLSQNQYDALVSLTYNIGGGNFLRSTLLQKLNQQEIKGAADQFLVWDRSGTDVVPGLTKRRITERALFLTT